MVTVLATACRIWSTTLLRPGTNQFDNPWHKSQAEMSDDQFYNFMVWHRGLSIPRARDLNDADVQRGKELFVSMGCAHCHRPQWTTGDDNYWSPNNINLSRCQNILIRRYILTPTSCSINCA